jgi:hypothetical protein
MPPASFSAPELANNLFSATCPGQSIEIRPGQPVVRKIVRGQLAQPL